MAEKKTPNKGYQQLKSELTEENIGQVYIFHGEESYLREYYLGELKKSSSPRALRSSTSTSFPARDYPCRSLPMRWRRCR